MGSKRRGYAIHHSEETKNKIREARLGEKNPLFGKHLLEETKVKLRNAMQGEKNPAWKGDKATQISGRCRANRMFPCPKGMQRHHIDGNPLNNSQENIMIVTPKQHLTLDGRIKNLNRKGRIFKKAVAIIVEKETEA